ncbi:MAG TPA: 4Fe-4S binding protein [Syntrophomonas sp.]|nr:4Fe-4S binding protein [Syntrophomonas sp.]
MSYEKADKASLRRNRNIRLGVLVLILLLITGIGLLHQFGGSFRPAGVDALCPFGGIEAAYTLVASGVLLQKVAVSALILLAATIIVALIFRRAFCGQICPLGTLQELTGMLGAKITGKKYIVPTAVDKPARYLKYVVLLLIVVFTAITSELIYRPYDPWVAWQHLSSADIFSEFMIGFIVLIITLVGSMFVGRLFCRYLCPMGAFLALLFPVGRFGVKRNQSTCIKCKICNRECPMGIDIMGSEKVTSVECINCSTCVNACPVKDTLTISDRRGKSISPIALLVSVLLIFTVVVGVTTYTGDFSWGTQSLQTSVEKTGQFNPEEIKGFMTLKDVADASGIPKEAFQEEFKVADSDFTVPIKELVPKYGFKTEAIRAFSEEYITKNGSGK